MQKTEAYKALFAIMTLTLLSVIGMAMPYPILTPLLLDSPDNQLSLFMGLPPKILLALLIAAYPFGMLVGSSFIGSLSDIYGRKKTLLFTTFGSAAGYLVAGYAIFEQNFVLLMTARLVTGLCEGNISVARAMIADLHPIIDKTRGMALIYSVTYGGWLIGPLIGGYLMILGADIAFVLASLVTILSALTIVFFVRDAKQEALQHAANKNNTHISIVQHAIRHNSYTLLTLSPLRHVFFQYILIMLGLNAFYEFLPVWLFESLSQDSVGIGHMTALVTLAMIFTSVFLIEKLKAKFEIRSLITLGLVIFGLTQGMVYVVTLDTLLVYCLITGSSIAFFNVLLPVFLSDKFADIEPGKLFGLLTSTFCLSNALIALLGGVISLYGSEFTLMFGGILVLIGMLYFNAYFNQFESEESVTKQS